jgi:sulfur-oxidizing protein SoxX
MNKKFSRVWWPLAALLLTACSSALNSAGQDRLASEVIQQSFQERGIATLDRLVADEANRACSAAEVTGRALDAQQVRAIEAANLKTVQWPADGQFLGDWKQGELIAQSGRGLTWTDTATTATANGGNCYNCHQISKAEISFGNLGPSLYQYGKLRGVTDPASAAAKPIVEYTWGKLWNSRAYNACSQMPRAGHKGILTPDQIRHVMALLLDPASPVNQ